LPSHLFGDRLARALDRGKQLLESAGLSLDPWSDGMESEANGSVRAPLSPKSSAALHAPLPAQSAPAAHPRRGPAAIETDPLATLQALQTALREAKDLNTLLGTLVRALHQDGGFARVALALLNPNDNDQLVGRLILGTDQPTPYLGSLSGSLTKDHSYFLRLMKRSEPVLIKDFTVPMSDPVSLGFLQIWNPGSAIVAPLRVGTRAIGMIYCDNGPLPQQVQPKDYQAFQLFFGQTTLSMNRLAGLL